MSQFCRRLFFIFFIWALLPIQVCSLAAEESDSPKALVLRAIQHWRGISTKDNKVGAITRAEMEIVRDNYTRKLELSAHTGGRKNSLVRFTAPSKDAGNATLMKGDDVWTFNPRTSRVIKIPPSMKSQSWMGSDFSYQDLAKDDEIIDEYEHTELPSLTRDNRTYRVIRSVPKDNAPVVWGKEELEIRDDLIIEVHRYYDQSGILIKTLRAEEIGMLGGRIYPITLTMKNEESGNYTRILHTFAKFDEPLEESVFSTTNLRKGRETRD